MKTFYTMLLKIFIPTFLVFLSFFILVFQLIDLFSNLWRYINNDVGFREIGNIVLLYLPKCITYSIPVAMLFAISYSLGTLYTSNEMLAIFGSGIRLYSFVTPLLIIGLVLSVGTFLFDENIVINTLRDKNDMVRRVLNLTENYSTENVSILSADSSIVYHAAYYNDADKTLSGVIIIEKGESRIDASYAKWNNTNWELHDCNIYSIENKEVTLEKKEVYNYEKLIEPPVLFKKITRKVDEMEMTDAWNYIESIKRAGLPYQGDLSEFYRKFSFALLPLIVAMISSSIGSLFRRNVVFASLLISLGIVIGFYVFQMITMAMAKSGNISPFLGA